MNRRSRRSIGSSLTALVVILVGVSIALAVDRQAGDLDTVSFGGGQDLGEPSLAWCPPKGSPDAHPHGRVRIATWNIENLHASDGGSTYTGERPSVKRTATDYDRIRCYVRMFDPDILAVQEVDGEEALRRVVDTDVYEVHVSSRPKAEDMAGRQNTGFAYKKGLDVVERADVERLAVGDETLRWGTRIDLTVGGRTVPLLSVHLKSGCFDDRSVPACEQLFQQVPELEAWIDEAAAGPYPFVVLGDFNRRLNRIGDLVWTDLDDGVPANADLLAVTEDRPTSCRNNRFTEFIDHIVADRRASAWVDRSSFRQIEYRQADKESWDKISDHCPVVVELWIPR